MPTRGRVAYVQRAVESVLRQSCGKYELLILDNSEDRDKREIRKISETDPRITLIDRGDTGVCEARGLGARLSKGRLFALMDSDDYWDPNRLRRHADVWTRYHIGISWDAWAEVREGVLKKVPQPFSEGLIEPPRVARALYSWNFIHASAGIVPVRFARSLRLPTGIQSSDWPLFLRAAEVYPAYFIGDSLSFKDLGAPQRVSDVEKKEFLEEERVNIRRWALRRNPRTYASLFLRTQAYWLLRRIGLKT